MSEPLKPFDVSFDHNPFGPLPRENDGIYLPKRPPTPPGHKATKPSEQDPTDNEICSKLRRGKDFIPTGEYDADINFLGPLPEGYRPPVPGRCGAEDILRLDEATATSKEGSGQKVGEMSSANAAGSGVDQAQNIDLSGVEVENQPLEDTRDAITRLFAGELDQGDEDQINMELDPTLQDQTANDTPGSGSAPETGSSGGVKRPKGSVDSPDGDGEKTGQKRKGSSRANMLTRGGACEFCKRRKLKCSAEVPACTTCVKTGRQCVYSQKTQKSKVRTLEDRLIELERRLDDGSRSAPPGSTSGSGPRVKSDIPSNQDASTAPTQQPDPARSSISNGEPTDGLPTFDIASEWLANLDLVSLTSGIDGSKATGVGANGRPEPDLMTLADAAATEWKVADATGSWPWDGMSESELAGEIAKAVEGGKGVGEKIVGHLLSLYNKATSAPYLQTALPPSLLLRRLSDPSPPHPSLLLSVLPLLLPLSPSTTLSNPETAQSISKRLETPARLHGLHAVACVDPRMTDIMIGNVMRTYSCFEHARLLEGWTEQTSNVGLVWISGSGKMGGVGTALLGDSKKSDVEAERRNQRMMGIRHRSQVMSLPHTIQEAGERIELFWTIYLANVGPSVGWNVPSLIDENEITTPFPKRTYDEESIRDNTTISHLLNGEAYTGETDSDFCATIKALCLLNRATRLFDVPPSTIKPGQEGQIKRVTMKYMSGLTPLMSAICTIGHELARLIEAWMLLHSTMFYIHLKEEIDFPENSEAATEALDKALQSAERIIACVDFLRDQGDCGPNNQENNIARFALLAVGAWQTVGRTLFKIGFRLEKRFGAEGKRPVQARQMAWRLVECCKIVGQTMPYAMVMSQHLENAALGIDEKQGTVTRTCFTA